MNGQGNGHAAKPNAFGRGHMLAPSQPRSGAHKRSAPLPMVDVGDMNFTTNGPQYRPSSYGAQLEGRYPDFADPALAMPGAMEAAVSEPSANRAGRMDYAEHPSDMNAVEDPLITIGNEEQWNPVHDQLESLSLRMRLVEKGLAEVLRNQKQQIQGMDHMQQQTRQFINMVKEVMQN